MTTSEERAELRRLLGEATPGPWRQGWADEDDWCWVAFCDDEGARGQDRLSISSKEARGGSEEADAALIVALRNNAEALLDTADARDSYERGWRDEKARAEANGESLEQIEDHAEDLQSIIDTYYEPVEADRDQLRAESDDLADIAGLYRVEVDRLKDKLDRVEAVLKDWEDDWTCNDSIPSVLHDFQAALKDPHV